MASGLMIDSGNNHETRRFVPGLSPVLQIPEHIAQRELRHEQHQNQRPQHNRDHHRTVVVVLLLVLVFGGRMMSGGMMNWWR